MFDPSLFCTERDHVRPVGGGAWIIDGHTTGDWWLRRVGNGTSQVLWTCRACGHTTSSVPYAFARAAGQSVDDLPIGTDYLGLNPGCEVTGCERRDTELNHTYPRAIDPEKAEIYPQVWLCRFHHEEWGHDVTPHLNPPRRAA